MAGANSGHAARERQCIEDRHAPNVMRQLVAEGGRVQKRMCDTAWSDEKKLWQGFEARRTADCAIVRHGVKNHDAEGLGKWEQCKGLKCRRKVWEVAKRNHVAPSREGKQVENNHLSVRKCESEKHQSWSMPADCLELSGSSACGQWCSSVMTSGWHQCKGCTVRWMLILRYSVPSRRQL